jgi:hypothetical protein
MPAVTPDSADVLIDSPGLGFRVSPPCFVAEPQEKRGGGPSSGVLLSVQQDVDVYITQVVREGKKDEQEPEKATGEASPGS